MSIEDLTTIDQVITFLEGTQRVIFEVPRDKDLRYVIHLGARRNLN